MMVAIKSFIAVAPLAAVNVYAWGPLGHATVASVAMQYLLPETRYRVNQIMAKDPAPFVVIPPTTSTATSTSLMTSSLAISSPGLSSTSPTATIAARAASASASKVPTLVDIASWADAYRALPEGAFSAAFHYIDAEDTPPYKCNVKFNRDCATGGCIVSAIANYTERVQDHSLDATQRAQALKWITHFIGDIQQPLHDEALAIGGNQISILWNGTVNNLHHIWDTEMPTKMIGPFTPDNVNLWTKSIVKNLKHGGKYHRHLYDWVSCDDIDNAEECAMSWAREANSYVCSYVVKTDPSGKELSGDYYLGAAPIIDMQIAKGGVRLAAWLNTIFAGRSGFW